MVVRLTPDQQEIVQHFVDRYTFAFPNAVIDEALTSREEQHETERIRGIVIDVRREVAQGMVEPFSPKLVARINADAEKMLRGGIEMDPDAWG